MELAIILVAVVVALFLAFVRISFRWKTPDEREQWKREGRSWIEVGFTRNRN